MAALGNELKATQAPANVPVSASLAIRLRNPTSTPYVICVTQDGDIQGEHPSRPQSSPLATTCGRTLGPRRDRT